MAVEWLEFLLRDRAVPGSSLGPDVVGGGAATFFTSSKQTLEQCMKIFGYCFQFIIHNHSIQR
jgi:hypothetical protein